MAQPTPPRLGFLRKLRRRSADESGVVLAFVAIMMIAFMGMAALAIDLGSYWQAQRQAQTAADAGALAGSQDLPNNLTGATNDATTYAKSNDPAATVNVTTNYNSDVNDIKVTVNGTTPSFFGQFFGKGSQNVTASAVAGENGKSQQGAIFAYADGGNCSTDVGISLTGNSMGIGGGIQSDGKLTVSTNPATTLYSGTFGTSAGCGFSGTSGAFTNAPYASAPIAYPADYRVNNTPVCGVYETGTYTFTSANLANNTVYCNTSGTFVFSSTGLTATGDTFEANLIDVTGTSNSLNLSAPTVNGGYGLLFYQTGCDSPAGELHIDGQSGSLNGTIFAPCATVSFTGNSGGTGFIEANNVVINKNSFGITGDGPVVAGSGDALLQ
jgi:hypothetical protein